MHALFTLALAAALTSPAPSELLLKVGDPAPPFAMRDLERKQYSLSDYTGPGAKEPKKAVLMAFFATWCEPCKKEIPIIKSIYRRWKAKNVGVVYVGLSQGPKDLEPFAKEQALPWPLVPDGFGLLGRRYGASQLPHLFIIGPDGRIAFQHRGIAPDLGRTIDEQLARITGEKAPDPEAPQDIVRPRFSTTLKLARLPATEGSGARWQPLAAFVGEAVSANVEIATETSYDGFEAALKQGKYDIANAGPLVCDAVRTDYEPVARLERQGTATYEGIFFVKRESPIKAIAELKGKRLGLVSARSTSGGLYQKLALIEAGLNPDRDLTIVWLGTHEKVAAAVKAGEVDAGGCFEDCRDAAFGDERAKAAATRILAYTPPIPGEMIIVKRSLEPKTKEMLRKALLSLNDSNGILTQISQGELPVTAFAPATEKDLEAVRAVLTRVGGEAKP